MLHDSVHTKRCISINYYVSWHQQKDDVTPAEKMYSQINNTLNEWVPIKIIIGSDAFILHHRDILQLLKRDNYYVL